MWMSRWWTTVPGFDLSEVLGREGEAEQLAFKAWVEETYNIVWESDLRNAIKARIRCQ